MNRFPPPWPVTCTRMPPSGFRAVYVLQLEVRATAGVRYCISSDLTNYCKGLNWRFCPFALSTSEALQVQPAARVLQNSAVNLHASLLFPWGWYSCSADVESPLKWGLWLYFFAFPVKLACSLRETNIAGGSILAGVTLLQIWSKWLMSRRGDCASLLRKLWISLQLIKKKNTRSKGRQ